MPPVSERQRRAMYAAREGRSTLGIPRSVGREFTSNPSVKAPSRNKRPSRRSRRSRRA